MTDRTAFTLETPVTVATLEYTELSLRKPKVKDLRLLSDKDPIGSMNKFIASLADVPPSAIEELFLDDMKPIQAWVMGFIKPTEE